MFNIGAGELVFILVAALLVLGPQRLPEFARAIGKFVREFRRQTDEVRTVVEREFYKMDQEFQEEPRPQVPLATPAALPSPVPVTPQVTPAVTPEALATVATPVGEAPVSAVEPSPASEPSAAGAEQPDALPRLEPIPGTVARNASKSG
ncbi:twin-arginine translocase TatA/TatE family subunit [Archangium violaceum]|uniref:Sec-independent protein translocase subunit TatA/TatB n=1 Tax=Archangium violaceum TaxID=83451 RepID=UPI0019516386|nr:twin-arginine translocase TatA/TatE family subunit [Archangium violaceum]QRN99449.1 twin-arginine translocase TatA/TatE family subunit [Archangium violaceum]